jgi:hypothetical protein
MAFFMTTALDMVMTFVMVSLKRVGIKISFTDLLIVK